MSIIERAFVREILWVFADFSSQSYFTTFYYSLTIQLFKNTFLNGLIVHRKLCFYDKKTPFPLENIGKTIGATEILTISYNVHRQSILKHFEGNSNQHSVKTYHRIHRAEKLPYHSLFHNSIQANQPNNQPMQYFRNSRVFSRYVLQHPQTYCCPKKLNNNMNEVVTDESTRITPEINEAPIIFTLLPDLHLPTEICEKLFATLHEEGLDIEDCTAGIFADVNSCRLRRVNVRCSSITDHGLEYLLRHNLRDLDIHNCEALTSRTLESLNKYSKHLVNLNIGNTVQILPDYIYPKSDELDEDDVDSLDEEDRARTVFHERGYILNAPHLQKLCIRDLFVTRGSNYLSLLLKPLPKLTHLDLSSLHHTEGLGDLEVLKELTQLTSLVLHNFTQGITSEAVKTICQIKTLRHLDLSHQEEKMGKFLNPNETLAFIVQSLPHLTSLDISGTNLAGGSAQTSPTTPNAASKTLSSANSGGSGLSDGLDEEDLGCKCDIPGLASRVNNPLEFLGLYKTSHDACYRVQIPAKQVGYGFFFRELEHYNFEFHF